LPRNENSHLVRGAEERGLPLGEATAFRAVPGMGIEAEIDGEEVLVGNDLVFAEFGVAIPAGILTAVSDVLWVRSRPCHSLLPSRPIIGPDMCLNRSFQRN
jgi:hypothetical protein